MMNWLSKSNKIGHDRCMTLMCLIHWKSTWKKSFTLACSFTLRSSDLRFAFYCLLLLNKSIINPIIVLRMHDICCVAYRWMGLSIRLFYFLVVRKTKSSMSIISTFIWEFPHSYKRVYFVVDKNNLRFAGMPKANSLKLKYFVWCEQSLAKHAKSQISRFKYVFVLFKKIDVNVGRFLFLFLCNSDSLSRILLRFE